MSLFLNDNETDLESVTEMSRDSTNIEHRTEVEGSTWAGVWKSWHGRKITKVSLTKFTSSSIHNCFNTWKPNKHESSELSDFHQEKRNSHQSDEREIIQALIFRTDNTDGKCWPPSQLRSPLAAVASQLTPCSCPRLQFPAFDSGVSPATGGKASRQCCRRLKA